MPAGVQGSGPGHPSGKPAEVQRVHAVDVLVRVDALQRGVVVEVLRRRVLDEQPVHLGVGVEPVDDGVQIVLRGVGGQVLVRRGKPELRGLALFDADVSGARIVIADENRRERRNDSTGAQRRNAGRNVGQDLLSDGSAGQQNGSGRGHTTPRREDPGGRPSPLELPDGPSHPGAASRVCLHCPRSPGRPPRRGRTPRGKPGRGNTKRRAEPGPVQRRVGVSGVIRDGGPHPR